MDRRSFLGASAVVVAGVPTVAMASPDAVRKPGGLRVSCVKDDPGERAYAVACGDGKRVTVYLDGVEQQRVLTADEAEGFVERFVETPEGNAAINKASGGILRETVYGDVRVVIA